MIIINLFNLHITAKCISSRYYFSPPFCVVRLAFHAPLAFSFLAKNAT